MVRLIEGDHNGHGLNVGVIVAKFNETITNRLLDGTLAALRNHGVEDHDVTVVRVPGSFELPLVAKRMTESGEYNVVVCLGTVIRGETDHYEHVASQAARGIANVALETGVPVIFGVLTTNTMNQAIARSGGERGLHVQQPWDTDKAVGSDSKGNVGYSAGTSAVEMGNLTSPDRPR